MPQVGLSLFSYVIALNLKHWMKNIFNLVYFESELNMSFRKRSVTSNIQSMATKLFINSHMSKETIDLPCLSFPSQHGVWCNPILIGDYNNIASYPLGRLICIT